MIQEKVISEMIVAASKHFVQVVSDELIGQLTADFEKHLIEAGANKTEPQNFYTVFHVDAYRDHDYEMELWVQVEALQDNTIPIQFKTIPESKVAYLVVSEHYDNLQDAYDALFTYVKEQGYQVSADPRETYYYEDEAPLGFYTEIQLPYK